MITTSQYISLDVSKKSSSTGSVKVGKLTIYLSYIFAEKNKAVKITDSMIVCVVEKQASLINPKMPTELSAVHLWILLLI